MIEAFRFADVQKKKLGYYDNITEVNSTHIFLRPILDICMLTGYVKRNSSPKNRHN